MGGLDGATTLRELEGVTTPGELDEITTLGELDGDTTLGEPLLALAFADASTATFIAASFATAAATTAALALATFTADAAATISAATAVVFADFAASAAAIVACRLASSSATPDATLADSISTPLLLVPPSFGVGAGEVRPPFVDDIGSALAGEGRVAVAGRPRVSTTRVLGGAWAAAVSTAVTSEGASTDEASGSSPRVGEYTAGFFMAERELSLSPGAAAAGETADPRAPSPSSPTCPSGLTGLLQRGRGEHGRATGKHE